MRFTFSAIVCIVLFTQCKDKIKFVSKEVIIARSNPVTKMTIQVPESCDKFSQGVKISLDALVKYSGQEISLKGNYDKANVISEFSERIKTITTAQCKICQRSNIIDPNVSDQVFYNDLVKNYVEYQKIRDFSSATLNDSEKTIIANALADVYRSIYTTKLDELPAYIKDMSLSMQGNPGGTFKVFVNDSLVCATVADNSGNAICIINKKYLIPPPDKQTEIHIRYSAIGFNEQQQGFTLGELILLNKSGNKITFKA